MCLNLGTLQCVPAIARHIIAHNDSCLPDLAPPAHHHSYPRDQLAPPLHARLLLGRGFPFLVHDMASLYTVNQPEALRSLLVENRLDGKVVEHMMSVMKFSSVRHFARAFEKTNFRDGVIETILDNVPDCKNDLVQESRLRVAWEAARAMLEGALKRKETSLPAADFRVEDLHSNFTRAYGFSLDPGMLPDTLFLEQVSSQMKNGRVGLHDLRTMLPPILPGGNLEAKKRKTIGDLSDIVVIDVEPRLRKINTPAKAIGALAVLLNGYALCGLFQSNSEDRQGRHTMATCRSTSTSSSVESLVSRAAPPKQPNGSLMPISAREGSQEMHSKRARLLLG